MRKNFSTRFAIAVAGALTFVATPAVQAASYPCDVLTIVSPYPPGGTTDILARMLVPHLQKALGTNVIVDNKAGASSNIGTSYVARAKPDSCTALLGNNTGIVINRNMYKLQQDPTKALTPVVAVAAVPMVLYVNAAVPIKSVDDLVAQAKADPKKFNYASGGSGSPQHLAGEMLKLQKGIDLQHIPYKGQGPAMADVIAGHVPIAFETTAVALPQIRTGKIRALATTAPTKTESLPDLPTMNSLGFKDFDLVNWYGVFVPAGTPENFVNQLNQAVREALQTPEVKKRLADMDSLKVDGTPQEFASFIQKEIPRWEEVVKRSGAKVE